MKKDKVKLIVNGKKVVIEFKQLLITDIDDSMKKNSYKIAYWGKVLAEAEREAKQADNYYRHWRGVEGKKIAEETKIAEWKIKQELESTNEFIKIKDAIAKAQYNVDVLAHFYEALVRQSFILPSKGVRERNEKSSMGMTTKK